MSLYCDIGALTISFHYGLFSIDYLCVFLTNSINNLAFIRICYNIYINYMHYEYLIPPVIAC